MTVTGWDIYFEELTSFLRKYERQEGSANERFAEYAIERLEVCYRTLSQVEYNMEESFLTHNLQGMIIQLKILVLCSHEDWVTYRDSITDNANIMYSVSTTSQVNTAAGRPCFDISSDQSDSLSQITVIFMDTNILPTRCITEHCIS